MELRSPTCPIPNAHRRLEEDVRRLWHQAADAYEDPDGFRVAVNALIEALRNVTFVLQAEKAGVPDFDTWYEQWREIMKRDGVLDWLNKARVRVVHQGDLETFSTATAGIQASWDAPVLKTFEVPPLLPTIAIAGVLAEQDLPDDVRKQGLLTVERRWVAADLPEWELLEALAHAYELLSLLIADAHRQAGVARNTIDYEEAARAASTTRSGGRPRGMVASAGVRTVTVHLRTKEIVSLRSEEVAADADFGRRAMKRYGDFSSLPRVESRDPLELADWYMAAAKQVFAKDKWHAETVFLFHPERPGTMLSTIPEDQQGKYMFMNEVAAEVERSGYTGLVLIADSWYVTSFDELEPGQRAGEARSRKETLIVHAARSDGETRTLMTPYTRRLGRIKYGETTESSGGEYFLAPVMRVWGVSWPSEHDRTPR